MATQVPYSPVPTVAPQERPLPFRQLNVPIGAFGGLSAQALTQFGQVEGQVGNELYTRAIALQEFQERAKANEADAAFQQQQIGAFADYTKKMGDDAVQGLPDFMQQQEAIRKQMGAHLSPYAQEMYNNQTRNAYNRVAFSAGYHAQQEQRKYTIGSYDASIDAAKMGVPGVGPDGLDKQLSDVEKTVRDKGAGLGQPQNEIDQAVVKAKNETAYKQVMDMSDRGQAIQADQLRDKYAKAGILDNDSNAALFKHLKQVIDTTDVRTTTSHIFSGTATDWNAKDFSNEQQQIAVSGAESKGNYEIRGPTVQSGMYAGQQALGRYQVMPGNLQAWLSQAGMKPMTPDQFLKDHDAQDQLFNSIFGGYVKKYGLDGALSKWFTGDENAAMDRSDGFHSKAWYLSTAHAALFQNMDGPSRKEYVGSVAASRRPGDDEYKQNLIDTVEREKAVQDRELRNAQLENKQVVEQAMEPGPNGELVTSMEALSAKEGVKEALTHMRPSDRIAIENKLAANAKHGGYMATDESTATFNELQGIILNQDRTPEQYEQLMNFDTLGWKAPREYTSAIRKGQDQVRKMIQAPADISRAMGEIKDMLDDAGISRTVVGDKGVEENRFRGAFNAVLEEYKREYGKNPDPETQRDLASKLIADNARTGLKFYEGGRPGWLWGFNPGVPDAEATAIKNKYRELHGSDPDESIIQNAYIAKQYQILYGRK